MADQPSFFRSMRLRSDCAVAPPPSFNFSSGLYPYPFCFTSPISFFAPSSTLGQLCLPDFKPHIGAWGPPVILSLPSRFFASTPFFFSSAPSLPLTPVPFKYPNIGPTARSFASSFANHFLSGRLCDWIPILSGFFLKARRSVLHFRHFVYKCKTDCSPSPHHLHSADSIAPL